MKRDGRSRGSTGSATWDSANAVATVTGDYEAARDAGQEGFARAFRQREQDGRSSVPKFCPRGDAPLDFACPIKYFHDLNLVTEGTRCSKALPVSSVIS